MRTLQLTAKFKENFIPLCPTDTFDPEIVSSHLVIVTFVFVF